MDNADTTRECLLSDSDKACPSTVSDHAQFPPIRYLIVYVALLVSVLVNLILGLSIFSLSALSPRPQAIMPPSPYSGLALDTPTIYHHHTAYWSTNSTESDRLWDAIDTDPMVVALHDSWATAHNLSLSSRWPWDPSKGRYFLKLFHQLHCLKYVRRHMVALQRGERPLSAAHAEHCLDLLRKDVLCYGDDTPMPTNERRTAIGDGQSLMCRSYEKVVEWARDPERHACHRSLDEYRAIKAPIERYMFCEPGSRYYPVMKQYLDQHGHVDPYE